MGGEYPVKSSHLYLSSAGLVYTVLINFIVAPSRTSSCSTGHAPGPGAGTGARGGGAAGARARACVCHNGRGQGGVLYVCVGGGGGGGVVSVGGTSSSLCRSGQCPARVGGWQESDQRAWGYEARVGQHLTAVVARAVLEGHGDAVDLVPLAVDRVHHQHPRFVTRACGAMATEAARAMQVYVRYV